jgi:hypothetical protein
MYTPFQCSIPEVPCVRPWQLLNVTLSINKKAINKILLKRKSETLQYEEEKIETSREETKYSPQARCNVLVPLIHIVRPNKDNGNAISQRVRFGFLKLPDKNHWCGDSTETLHYLNCPAAETLQNDQQSGSQVAREQKTSFWSCWSSL